MASHKRSKHTEPDGWRCIHCDCANSCAKTCIYPYVPAFAYCRSCLRPRSLFWTCKVESCEAFQVLEDKLLEKHRVQEKFIQASLAFFTAAELLQQRIRVTCEQCSAEQPIPEILQPHPAFSIDNVELVVVGEKKQRLTEAFAKQQAKPLFTPIPKSFAEEAAERKQVETDFLRFAKYGHEGMVKNMLDRDPSLLTVVNSNGQTAFMLAAINGHPEATAELLRRGSNPDHRDFGGNTIMDQLSEITPAVFTVVTEFKSKAKFTVLLGLHERVGKESALFTALQRDYLYDRNVWPIIFGLL